MFPIYVPSISVMCFSPCTHGEGLASHQFHTTSQADPPLSLLAPLSIASIERVTRPFSPLTSIDKQSNNNNSLPFTLLQKKRPLYVHPNLVCSCIYTRTYKHISWPAGPPYVLKIWWSAMARHVSAGGYFSGLYSSPPDGIWDPWLIGRSFNMHST
jgi:hypothetical protein